MLYQRVQTTGIHRATYQPASVRPPLLQASVHTASGHYQIVQFEVSQSFYGTARTFTGRDYETETAEFSLRVRDR